jgi:hypothetical protein
MSVKVIIMTGKSHITEKIVAKRPHRSGLSLHVKEK